MQHDVTLPRKNVARNGLQIIEGGRDKVSNLPTYPVRQAIYEAWTDGRSVREITKNLGVSVETVNSVLWAFGEIARRSMALASAAMPRWARETQQQVAAEVWQELERRPGPKPTGGGAANLIPIRRAA